MDGLNDDYDTPWKLAVTRYFPDFIAFYFPRAHAAIDWSHPHVFLDEELAQLTQAPARQAGASAHAGRRRAMGADPCGSAGRSRVRFRRADFHLTIGRMTATEGRSPASSCWPMTACAGGRRRFLIACSAAKCGSISVSLNSMTTSTGSPPCWPIRTRSHWSRRPIC